MTHPYKIGEFARSIESGWLGQIIEIMDPETIKVDDTRSFTEQMCRMIGVDELAIIVCGLTLTEAIDVTDEQWFSLADLKPVRVIKEAQA